MNNEVIKKFGIDKFSKKTIINTPSDVSDFDGLSYSVELNEDRRDLIFVFIFSLDEFTDILQRVIAGDLLNTGGMLYFAYPKKGNKKYKEFIGRDDFFGRVEMDKDGYVNDSPLKFNKMAAFNDVFTVVGLKHEPTRKKASAQPSQCVADYIERIPDVRKYFERKKEVLEIFDSLTPGYQRDWTRYVFGVKNVATTEKRFAEMENILKQGYKSVDLYKRNK